MLAYIQKSSHIWLLAYHNKLVINSILIYVIGKIHNEASLGYPAATTTISQQQQFHMEDQDGYH